MVLTIEPGIYFIEAVSENSNYIFLNSFFEFYEATICENIHENSPCETYPYGKSVFKT